MLLPFSFDLTGRDILLVGGGKAALEKFQQLKRVPCILRIVSPVISEDLETDLTRSHAAQITVLRRRFIPEDLASAFMVFSAVNDEYVAEQIYQLCRSQKILINSADDKARCDFYTNALIDRGNIQVTVSTGGKFAGLSAILRRHLEALFPRELDADWEKIFALREKAVALQSVIEKKSVITDIVRAIESKYFSNVSGSQDERK
jgi:precorrin-2 dehydrogenase / sirohydrochlorin ferrochelatase